MGKPDPRETEPPQSASQTAIFVVNICTWIILPSAAALFCLIDGIKNWELYKFVLAAIGVAVAIGGWYFMRAIEQSKP